MPESRKPRSATAPTPLSQEENTASLPASLPLVTHSAPSSKKITRGAIAGTAAKERRQSEHHRRPPLVPAPSPANVENARTRAFPSAAERLRQREHAHRQREHAGGRPQHQTSTHRSVKTSAARLASRDVPTVPQFACLARSKPTDGHFSILINGATRGVVVSERNAARSDVHNVLYAFADAQTGTMRQKWASSEDLYREFVPFGELVESAFPPDRLVRESDDVLRACAELQEDIDTRRRALDTLETKKRSLSALAEQMGAGTKRLRRTTTLSPEESLDVHPHHSTPPLYWRIAIPVFPEADRRLLREFMDQHIADPAKTTLGIPRRIPSFLDVNDLVREASLSPDTTTVMRALLEELRVRAGLTQSAAHIAYTLHLRRFDSDTSTPWCQDDPAHTAVTAWVPVWVDVTSTDAVTDAVGDAVTTTHPTMEVFTEAHGRGEVDLVVGGVCALMPSVWRAQKSRRHVRWWALVVEVEP